MMDFTNVLKTFTSHYDEDDFESANVILIDRQISEMMGNDDNITDSYTFVTTSSASLDFLEKNLSSVIVDGTSSKNSENLYRDPLSIILPISIIYIIIFIAGILGNVITCVVISTNKTMHTATNYYLFNLAVSDSLILLIGKFEFSI
jgi:hypothetical protein